MKKKLKDMQGMRGISLEHVKAKADSDKKHRTTEQDAIAAFGEKRIERKYRDDGNYSWRVKVKQNDGHGKLTQDGHTMQKLLNPWAKSETERSAAQYGMPGSYGGGMRGKMMLPPLAIGGDWCSRCDSRMTWCECKEARGLAHGSARGSAARARVEGRGSRLASRLALATTESAH